ncbi:Crotonyl-CoA reductase [Candidatus Izimaplasma bacterium HR1]|uniref:NAD(P)-dependent alcohol dehydrogenase n=1 Tax=Candidatus Izimoplasma sp. HR1 TaxID=1541959 RepID=UPI0004F718C7|nr:Crotonyl-CoA reductase [Candidatus Izimaplasma bacterium HR1]
MKAIIRNKYGGYNNIQYTDVEEPELTDDSVLIKVHAASINQADVYMLQGKPLPLRFMTGLFKPKNKVLGSDVSGVITKVGSNITDYKVGDAVFGELLMNQASGYSEYAVMIPKQMTLKPDNVTHSEAAAVSMAGFTALQGARLANVKEGDKVLIYGASGGVGTFMIQVCKYFKAHVTAVVSTRNIDVAKASGADIIIDYKVEKWDASNIKYDVILACNGYNKLSRYRDALKSDGRYVISGGSMKQITDIMIKKPFLRGKKDMLFTNFVAKISKDDLDLMADLLNKKLIVPHIDKEFPLAAGKDAIKHFMENKTIGKTIIRVI